MCRTCFRSGEKLGMKPLRLIITNKLPAYVDDVERVFGSDTTHIQSQLVARGTHNYFRRQQSLKGKTPGGMAGTEVSIESWYDVVEL